MSQITKREYDENIAGYVIRDLAISHTGAMLLTLAEEIDVSDNAPIETKLAREGDLTYRFLNIILKEENYLTYMELRPSVNRALLTSSPNTGWISVDFNGYVWEGRVEKLQKWPGYLLKSDPFPQGEKKKLQDDDFAINFKQNDSWLSNVLGLTVIDGDVYVCGGIRKVLKRNDYNVWTDITLHKEHPQLRDQLIDAASTGNVSSVNSFVSVDGFNGDDIYACGSAGDCWHYSDKQWQQMNVPTHTNLNDIVCAPDGHVYIVANNGLVIKGRANVEGAEERWELLQQESFDLKSIVIFKNKIYVASIHNLYTLENDTLVKVSSVKDSPFAYKKLITNNETLILFGDYNALAFDGENWSTVFSKVDI